MVETVDDDVVLERVAEISAATTGGPGSPRGWTADEAFARLRALSQHQNLPVRAIAEDVVRTGDVPIPEPSRRERRRS